MKSIIYKFIVVVFIVLTLFIAGCSNYVVLNGKKISIDVARSTEEKARGLMFRENLSENSGMLFVYDDSRIRNFWMKDTLIPLDIIFIDENKIIKKIVYAKPCKNDPCEIYSSNYPAKYVLEVNGGYTNRNNIKAGDLVSINI